MKTHVSLWNEVNDTEANGNPAPRTGPESRREIEKAHSLSKRATYTMYELIRGHTGFGERPRFEERPGIL